MYEMKIYFYSIGICVTFYTVKIKDSFLMFLGKIINKIGFKSDKQFIINVGLQKSMFPLQCLDLSYTLRRNKIIFLICSVFQYNWFFNVLDPVKEYGCAPWPMVEKLIKKCLKENPQERPTSAQVFISLKFINILYRT